MKIAELMSTNVQTCRPTTPLDEVVKVMEAQDRGCLPVVAERREDEVVGMITDRDICLTACREGKRLDELQVSQAMSAHIHECSPGDDHESAERVMTRGRVRRIPVIEDGHLRGMVTLARIAQVTTDGAAGEIGPEEVGRTLAAICQPTTGSRVDPA